MEYRKWTNQQNWLNILVAPEQTARRSGMDDYNVWNAENVWQILKLYQRVEAN